MFGLPVQRRKVTTYGKATRPASYSLLRDEPPPDKSKPRDSDWQNDQKRTPLERAPPPTLATGRFVRPAPKPPLDTTWDVPSSDDEAAQPPASSSRPTKSSASSKVGKETIRSNVGQQRSPGLTRQPVVGQVQKRKKEISGRTAPQRAPDAHSILATAAAPAVGKGLLRQKSVPQLAAPAQIIPKRPAKTIETVLPARKRQRTPANLSPSKGTVSQRTRSRTTTPEPTRAYATSSRKPIRNVQSPSTPRRAVNTGFSAPAGLFSMIRETASPPTDSSDLPSDMDIDLRPSTPRNRVPVSPATTLRAGSVTPRQKELWGKLLSTDLLDVASDLSPISKLHLSNGATRERPSLARSASEVTHTAHSRRVRLIDSLKASAPIVEEDEEMEDVDEDEESEAEGATAILASSEIVSQPEINLKSTMKVTYAQQRSYLEPKDEAAAFDQMVEEMSQGNEAHESQYQGDVEEDNQQSVARGFHDLRAAGANRRLFDMFDNLINDVQEASNSLSIRRSALMELATKLMDEPAVAYFLDRGFDRRLIKAISDVSDTISNFTMTAAVALIAEGGASSDVLHNIHRSKWYSKAVELLDVDADIGRIMKERRSNMSKMAQTSISEFKDAILGSKLWTGVQPKSLSPRLMALKCIELLVRRLREHGNQDALLDEKTIGNLLAISKAHTGQDAVDNVALVLVLSVLESSTAIVATQKRSAEWPAKLVQSFSQLFPSLISSTSLGSLGSYRCGDLALRLTVNLTNEVPRACDIFGTAAIIQPLVRSINHHFDRLTNNLGSEERTMTRDRLILSLGAMINLSEFSDKVRLSVIEGEDQLLDQAVKLFLAGRERTGEEESIEALETNVPYGYLAICLGNLCQNDQIRRKVQSKLPGTNLASLVNAVDEFAKFYQIVDRDTFDGDEGNEVSSNYTARLQVVADRLRSIALD